MAVTISSGSRDGTNATLRTSTSLASADAAVVSADSPAAALVSDAAAVVAAAVVAVELDPHPTSAAAAITAERSTEMDFLMFSSSIEAKASSYNYSYNAVYLKT